MNGAVRILLVSLLLLPALSCTTLGGRSSAGWEQATLTGKFREAREQRSIREQPEPGITGPEVADIQEKLIQGARSLLGKEEIIVRGKRFPMDCTGVVLAIYYFAGIDLAKDFPSYTGNGVARLHSYLADRDLIYDTLVPRPGDIIFWDNTYDRNEDGLWNDTFTHAGMVVQTSAWGTIDYVHHNYRKGIVLERMNLKEPDVHQKEIDGSIVIINSPMRMRGSPKGPGWLASHLYRDFGRGYKLPPD